MIRRFIKKGKVHITRSTDEVLRQAKELVKILRPFCKRIKLAGSIRRKVWKRGKPVIDIDIVLIPKNRKAKMFIYKHLMDVGSDISPGPDTFVVEFENVKKISTRIGGIKVDVFLAASDHFGAMMLFATGSGGHNIGLRRIAMKKGLKLNQYGLWKGSRRIANTETGIYKSLGRPRYKPPEERN